MSRSVSLRFFSSQYSSGRESKTNQYGIGNPDKMRREIRLSLRFKADVGNIVNISGILLLFVSCYLTVTKSESGVVIIGFDNRQNCVIADRRVVNRAAELLRIKTES